ncbi:MAG: hypothetical protein IJ748_00120 [Bacteroidales bacterium]|nr:hypothetical protein [Bacteroidales bacterium]
MKKRIAAIASIVLLSTSMSFAQGGLPPAPDETPQANTGSHSKKPTSEEGPIGTATALLLSLGAGTLAYKVKKNRSQE